MINYHALLVSALKTVLPTHYEMALTTNTQTPCISYQERNNYVEPDAFNATIGCSRISYTVKIWGKRIEDLQAYALQVDAVLRPLGFRRTSSQELYDINSSMIQKILTYECIALEEY